jgi:processive 1,2-diacylglycerol beta-glucosyltransferase/1,2-diacylglycerol 3-beta-galactosyltransferase
METLAMRKPLIISTYIHGQELGNMRFVTQSGAGWFIQKPKDIYARLKRLALNPAEAETAKQNAAKTGIVPNNDALTEYIASL